MGTDHFAKLPFELVLSICEYLPSESIVCLALSKKFLYQSQGLRKLWQPKMDPSQRITSYPRDFARQNLRTERGMTAMLHWRRDILNHDLLRTLDLLHRDLPDHWLCDICLKLHQRVAYTVEGRAYSPCDESRRQGLLYRLPTWNYEFPFEYAQQVVKRHDLGTPHGSPLTILQKRQDWETISDWPTQSVLSPEQSPVVWYRRLEVTPVICHEDIGPVLDLWTEQHLRFPSDYMAVVRSRSRDWVGDIGRLAQAHFSVCCHQHDTGRDVADLLERPRTEFRANSRLRRCELCLTEYAFFIWEGDRDDSIHVVLSTWVTLGSCRYSFSPAWLTSSWLSSGHSWGSWTISRRPRPFHNDTSAFYPDEAITRAVSWKRGSIVRPSNMMSRLTPSRYNGLEPMRS
jgi:hypothetical protein